MARTSDTRQRIFDAATAEFADHGIAGARVDRIAAAAGANKQLIYAYFGDKETLFRTVVCEHLGRFIAEVPFDPADLPGHAVALYEFYAAHPEVADLGAWHTAAGERGRPPLPEVEQAFRTRSRAVARAQKAGAVNASIRPNDLLVAIAAVARAFAVTVPEAEPSRAPAARRAAVRTAAERLAAP